MNPDRWAETRSVFLDALAVEPAARPGFVAGRCDGDSALRQDVEDLLEADARTGDGAFLREVIAAVARDLFAPASPEGSVDAGAEARHLPPGTFLEP